MSASSRAPEGLKDSECKKGKLGIRPPIPYVPPTDLLKTKETSDSLKVKLPDGTVFTMQIFAKGNPEEYLSHMQAVLRLIGNKGLDAQCKKLMKERNEQTTVLEALKLKSIGPRDASPEEDPDEIKAEIKETKELALETQNQYNIVVASTYKLLRNLLASERTIEASSASSGSSGGSRPGRRAASIDLPEPGGPIISRLCPPAAAISSTRLALSWPLISLRSG